MVLDSEANTINEEEKAKSENTYQKWFTEFLCQQGITLNTTYTIVAFIDFTSTPFRETSRSVLNLLDSSTTNNEAHNSDPKHKSPPDLERLQVYCDASSCILYLSISLNLTAQDILALSEVKEGTSVDKDDLSLLEYQTFRTLLFTFLISDLVVILNDSRLLTSTIISTLRLLSTLKRRIFPLLTAFEEQYSSGNGDGPHVDIGRGLSHFVRKVPTISFVFHGTSSNLTTRKFLFNLESRIKFIFRACGLLEHHERHFKYDGRQLFSLSPNSSNQSFVHFASWNTESNPVMDLLNHYFRVPTVERPSWEQLGKDDGNIDFDHVVTLKNQLLEWIKRSYELRSKRNFSETTALEIGYWVEASGFLFAKIFVSVSNADRKKSMEEIVYRKLKDYVELDRHVSLCHCKQAMKKSVDWYISECPPHYTEQLHEHKLNQALQHYRSMARGPCSSEFLNSVKKECQKYWENGHQRCEASSLTGHECGLSNIHGTGKESSRGGGKRDAKHKSPFQALHACNCGRSRRVRDDPFSLKEANYGFFKIPECCNNDDIVSYDFPVESFDTPMWSLVRIGPSNFYRPLFGLEKWDGFIGNCNFLMPWCIPSDETLNSRPEYRRKDSTSLSNGNNSALKEDTANRDQERLSEHSNRSGFDDKPRRSRRNRRNRGVGKHGRDGRSKPNGYLGIEYECPLGHRFLSCGSGRVCKLGHTEMEEAHSLIEQDFPIYITCPCSNTTTGPPINAQLQRIIMVTPSAPINCVLSPTVKIEVNERLISVPLCNDEGLTLPKESFMVLRLPYIYYDGKAAIAPPPNELKSKFYLAKNFLHTHSSEEP
ncbi:hypothetical protein K7432_008616 [Basidiobolus ranarum]|uniref:Nonsense-mediated mRNA decay factor SMG8 n=1 Tax=Basidiobolus ranarum TaxID=34480 RepID=A0ABR2WRJ1_9FUNG